MITEDDLQGREKISNEEIHQLIEQNDVLEMDLADACNCTHSTFKIYLGDNSTKMPKKHQETIIHFFRTVLANGESKSGEKSKSQKEDTDMKKSKESNQAQKEVPAERSDDFKHLVPERIIFKPKDGVADAVNEAADIAEEENTMVLVRVDQRLIGISVEES